MPSVDQFVKFLLSACEPGSSDALFMAAVRALRRRETIALLDEHPGIFSAVLRTFATAASVRCLEQPDLEIEALVGITPLLRRRATPGAWSGDTTPLDAARTRVAEVFAASARASDEAAYDAVWRQEAQRRSLEALFVEGLYLGEAAALAAFAATLARGRAYAPIDGRASVMADSLVDGGWFDAMGPAGLDQIGQALCQEALAIDSLGLSYLMHALGYSWISPQAHVAALSQRVFFPLIGRLFDIGRSDVATQALQWAFAIDRAPDRVVADGSAGIQSVVASAVAAGQRLGEILDGNPSGMRLPTIAPWRIGFVVSAFASPETLAQVVHLAPRLRRTLDPKCAVIFYFLDGFSASLDADLKAAGLGRWWAGAAGARPLNRMQQLHDLRSRLRADSIQIAVWCDSLELGFFALGSRLAPSQVLLTQRALAAGPVPAVAQAASFDILGGVPDDDRRIIPWVETEVEPGDQTAHEERRAALNKPGCVMIGSVVSDSRLWSREFLGVVAKILAERANAVFVWAGADLDPEQLRRIVGPALAPRFLHLDLPVEGFVRAVDILLEPFECMDSRVGLGAMAAGAPVVSAKETPSLLVRAVVAALGSPRRSGRGGDKRNPLALALAEDEAAVVRQTLSLVDDVGLRRALGEALRATYRQTFNNLDAGAEALAQLLRDLRQPIRRVSQMSRRVS